MYILIIFCVAKVDGRSEGTYMLATVRIDRKRLPPYWRYSMLIRQDERDVLGFYGIQ